MITDGFAPDFVEIYHEYLAEFPGLLTQLREAVQACDATTSARLAHQIKGSSANFGFVGTSRPAANLEQEAKQDSLTNAETLIDEAEAGFHAAVAEVKSRAGV